MADLDIVLRLRDQASRGLGRFSERIGGASNRFQQLSKFAKIAGAAGLAAGVALAKSAFDATLEIGRMADAASTTTDQIQRFQVIAARTGGTVDAFADGQRELGIRLGELAAHGSGPAVDALASLNIEYSELARLSPEQQYDRIVDSLLGVEDTSQRAFLAEELLGGQWAENSRVLNLSRAEYAAHAQAADESRKVTAENVESIEQLNSWVNEAKRTLLVFVSNAIGAVIRGFQNWRDIVGNVLQVIGDGLEAFLNYFIQGFNGWIDVINNVIDTLNKVPGVNIQLINSIGELDLEWRGLVGTSNSVADGVDGYSDAIDANATAAQDGASANDTYGASLSAVREDALAAGAAIEGLYTAQQQLNLAMLGFADVASAAALAARPVIDYGSPSRGGRTRVSGGGSSRSGGSSRRSGTTGGSTDTSTDGDTIASDAYANPTLREQAVDIFRSGRELSALNARDRLVLAQAYGVRGSELTEAHARGRVVFPPVEIRVTSDPSIVVEAVNDGIGQGSVNVVQN